VSIVSQSLLKLFDESTKCKRLNEAKIYTFPVIQHYAVSDLEKYNGYAHKILNCSNDLKLRVCTEIGELGVTVKSSIENARWCRCRQCPMCQFARSSKIRAKLFKRFKEFDFGNQDSYSFLTLTLQNCPLNELRETIGLMNSAWDKFSRRRTFPVIGYLRSLEVTMQRDRMPWDKKKNTGPPSRSPDDQLMAHPHFHILLRTVDGFQRHTKDKPWLIGEWTSALRADYRPSIDIKKVRPTSLSFTDTLLEVAKYTVKPAEFSDVHSPVRTSKPCPTKPEAPKHRPHGAEWLYGITEQLHNLRAYRLGGDFAKILSQREIDTIDDSVGDSEEKSQVGNLIRLVWNDVRNKYDAQSCDYSDEDGDDNC
jgi:hypothetical protein